MPRKAERKPTGRDEVMSAIVHSAERLWSERGPAAVSLRQIAADAGVNYGLVYQYLGTRENLLRTVFRRLSEEASEEIEGATDLHGALVALRDSRFGETYVRMLAWTLLEGHDPREFLGRSPALDVLARAVVGEEDDDAGRQARVAIALSLVVNTGWLMFGDFFAVALGLDEDREQLDVTVRALLHRMPAVVAGLDGDAD